MIPPIISGPSGQFFGSFNTSHGNYAIPYGYNRLNYTQAESLCQIAGAQIVAFETAAEFQAMRSKLSGVPVMDQYWLNGNDRRQDGKFHSKLL